MTKKEYRAFYLALVHLYGAISSNVAYEILRFYGKNSTKKTFLSDLKSRGPFPNGFMVWKTAKKDVYVISLKNTTSSQIDSYFEAQTTYNLYLPETFEEFLAYKETSYILSQAVEPLNDYFKRELSDEWGEESLRIAMATLARWYTKYNTSEDELVDIHEYAFNFVKKFIDADLDFYEFMQAIEQCSSLLRIPCYAGHTSKETSEIRTSQIPELTPEEEEEQLRQVLGLGPDEPLELPKPPIVIDGEEEKVEEKDDHIDPEINYFYVRPDKNNGGFTC